jgi:hypothetical protein
MGRTIPSNVVKAAEKRNVFASNGFRLKDEFTGEYEITNVMTRAINSKTANAFTVHMRNKNNGMKLVVPDWILGRAFIAETANDPNFSLKVKNKTYKGIAYFDNPKAEKVVGAADRFGEKFINRDEDGEVKDIELPDTITVLGAVTTKVQDDEEADDTVHPAIPLRYYKGYQAVLKYHRLKEKEAGNEDWESEFITRAQFLEYLQMSAEAAKADRIPGVPDTLTTLELVDPKLAENMAVWNAILVLADTK